MRTSFQLYLLSRMQATRRVRDALSQLGLTESDMFASAEIVAQSGFDRSGHPASLYRDWLGQPHAVDAVDTDASDGYHGARRLRFRLGLWPLFDFAVHEHPDGWAYDPGFVRRQGVSFEAPPSYEALAPWLFVREDLEGTFGPGRLAEGWEHTRELILMIPPSVAKAPIPFRVVFDFDLLQSVRIEDRAR